MAYTQARFLSPSRVTLHCEQCDTQVDTIHSNEILPLLMYLSRTEQKILCFDCDNSRLDEIPEALGKWVDLPACLVVHNSTKSEVSDD